MVARDTVCITFLNAALNNLDIMSCDIGNAYLNVPCQENVWCEAGIEFGSDKGKVLQKLRVRYALKSSGASWQKMLATSLINLGYFLPTADPDLWLKPRKKPNRDEYHSMVLV